MANEKRLIDANAFSNEWWLAKFVEYKGRLRLVDTKLLRDIPTVDAVEVVRCKDCKHRTSSEFCECRPEAFFCAEGERKDNED